MYDMWMQRSSGPWFVMCVYVYIKLYIHIYIMRVYEISLKCYPVAFQVLRRFHSGTLKEEACCELIASWQRAHVIDRELHTKIQCRCTDVSDAQMSRMQAEGESYGERSGQEEGASQSVLAWMVCIHRTSYHSLSNLLSCWHLLTLFS